DHPGPGPERPADALRRRRPQREQRQPVPNVQDHQRRDHLGADLGAELHGPVPRLQHLAGRLPDQFKHCVPRRPNALHPVAPPRPSPAPIKTCAPPRANGPSSSPSTAAPAGATSRATETTRRTRTITRLRLPPTAKCWSATTAASGAPRIPPPAATRTGPP